jgi:hypothetical protein
VGRVLERHIPTQKCGCLITVMLVVEARVESNQAASKQGKRGPSFIAVATQYCDSVHITLWSPIMNRDECDDPPCNGWVTPSTPSNTKPTETVFCINLFQRFQRSRAAALTYPPKHPSICNRLSYLFSQLAAPSLGHITHAHTHDEATRALFVRVGVQGDGGGGHEVIARRF